jgi:hypothetical protein
VHAQRFAERVADERRAIGHISSGAIELGIGEEHEPGAECRTVTFVLQPDLAENGQADEEQRCGEREPTHARNCNPRIAWTQIAGADSADLP